MKTDSTIAAISITLSVLTLAVLIYACRCGNNSCCDNNLIVSALSILVTVLIGWQIYQVIDFERRVRKIADEVAFETAKTISEKGLKELRNNLDSTNGFLQISMSWQFWFNLSDEANAKNAIKIALAVFIKIDDKAQIKFCQKQLKYYNNNIPPRKSI